MIEPDWPQMQISCWIPKGYKRTLRIYLFIFHCNNVYMNALRCYVIRILPVYGQNSKSDVHAAHAHVFDAAGYTFPFSIPVFSPSSSCH